MKIQRLMEKLKDKKTLSTASPDNTAEATTKKRTNKTWEAFGKSKGCFIINDPKFLL